MQRIFKFISDPGHGWGKVPVKLLKDLKIADKISSYSYYRKGFAYLEEDCDLPIFINTMKNLGNPVLLKSHYYKGTFGAERSSKIRNYEVFNGNC